LPVAVDDVVATRRNTAAEVDVVANDTDVEGPLTVTAVTQGAHGTVTISGNKVKYAQTSPGGWTSADLLPGAGYVIQAASQPSVMVYQGSSWRSVYTTNFPEYESSTQGRHLIFNALVWTTQRTSVLGL
jgi:hypothetical protein